MKRITSIAMITVLTLNSIAVGQSISESDWQVAFNNMVMRGKLEVRLPTGRVDIMTDEYAVEVDRVKNYRDGIKQALQYAAATKRKPCLALYMDGRDEKA